MVAVCAGWVQLWMARSMGGGACGPTHDVLCTSCSPAGNPPYVFVVCLPFVCRHGWLRPCALSCPPTMRSSTTTWMRWWPGEPGSAAAAAGAVLLVSPTICASTSNICDSTARPGSALHAVVIRGAPLGVVYMTITALNSYAALALFHSALSPPLFPSGTWSRWLIT